MRVCIRCRRDAVSLDEDGRCSPCSWIIQNRLYLKRILGEWQPETDKSEKKTEA